MVVVGNLTVQLVDATTKVPFKERTGPDGKTYVEAQPDAEYLIKVEIVGDEDRLLRIDAGVDGKSMEYYSKTKKKDGPKYIGSLTRIHGVESKKPFHFERRLLPERDSSAKRGAPSTGYTIGSVKVKLSEAVSIGWKVARDIIPPFIALRLIHAGILPKPPVRDQHRTEFKRRDHGLVADNVDPKFPSKKIKIDAVYDEDIMIAAPKVIEVVDMTSANDDN